jgi:hypothetical protein
VSDLPDIETGKVSFIAYFNAIDQGGVNDIDPTEVTNHSNVQSYTLYDNGVEGVYNTVTGRNCDFRVKEDGWFVAWFNRDENFNNNSYISADDVRGPWDLLNDWVDHTSADDITANSLERCINALKSELSNSGSVTYSASDVGLYDYRYSSAAGITALSTYHREGSENTSTQQNPGLQYTSGTTVHWAAGIGTVRADAGFSDLSEGEVDFNGTDIAYANTGDNDYNDTKDHGGIDLISRGLIPDADTEYTGLVRCEVIIDNEPYAEAVLSCLLVWE